MTDIDIAFFGCSHLSQSFQDMMNEISSWLPFNWTMNSWSFVIEEGSPTERKMLHLKLKVPEQRSNLMPGFGKKRIYLDDFMKDVEQYTGAKMVENSVSCDGFMSKKNAKKITMSKKKAKKIVAKKKVKKIVTKKKKSPVAKKPKEKLFKDFGEWWDKVAQKKVDKIERDWIKENEPNDPEDDGGGDSWHVNQMMHDGEAHNFTYEIAERVFNTGLKGESWELTMSDGLFCELDDVICEAYEVGKKTFLANKR